MCFTKTSRGIEHGRSFGEGKVCLLLPLRETVVHVRQIYVAKVRYFPPSDAVMRNWNILHNICEVLMSAKKTRILIVFIPWNILCLLLRNHLLVHTQHASIHSIFPLTCFGVRSPSSGSDTLIVYSLKPNEALVYVNIGRNDITWFLLIVK
jgi:hypothetical protein